jgi:hypothetical protein
MEKKGQAPLLDRVKQKESTIAARDGGFGPRIASISAAALRAHE